MGGFFEPSRGVLCVVSTLCLIAVSCGDGRATDTELETSLDVTPRGATIVLNKGSAVQQFRADVLRRTTSASGFISESRVDVTDKVSWSSSAPGVATIDAAGLARGLKEGATAIKATYATGGSPLTMTVPLLVKPGGTRPPLQVTPPTVTLKPGGTQQLTATASFGDGTSKDLSAQVTWTSSDTTTATVDSTGLVTGLAAGTATITAAYNSVTGQASVVVVDEIAQIEVAPVAPSMGMGSSLQLTAAAISYSGLKTDVTSQVTWSSSNSAIATVSSLGSVSAVAPGTCQIQAQLTVGGNTLSDSTSVTVSSPPLIGLQVTGPATVSGAAQYTAVAVFAGAPPVTLTTLATWTSSAPTVAAFSSSTPGQLQAIKSGTTTITAHYAGMASKPLTVTVSPPCPALTVAPAAAQTISVGKSFTFTLSCPALATWAVADASVLKIATTSTPTNYLATGLKAGTTTVFAQIGTMISNTVSVIVTP